MKSIWLTLPALALLAACGGGDGEGTSVTINGSEAGFSAKADKDGRVAVKAPGFEGSIKLPKFQIGSDNFEIGGVKLYPGSTIANLNVTGGDDNGGVKVEFDSPAAAAQVQDWFREQMQSAGFTLDLKDGALQGKTGEGSPFTLKLEPKGDAKSHGTLTVTGK